MTSRMRPPTVEELVARASHQQLEAIAVEGFKTLQPQERLTVTEAGEKYTRIGSGGGHSTPWSLRRTPYLKEPQDMLTSLDYQGMVFVGPARTGKTFMGLNFLTHTVMTDPADMMYVHMDRENARKWSKGDLERYLEASTDVRAEQFTNRKADNTFDKEFKSGMRFLLTYPTASNLSGITVPRVWLIDYERMDDNVDGEGNPFDLAKKRTTTFKRFGMTVAEASPNPNKEIQDPKWRPSTPHEAPPIRGIFELYNRGDRRRWNWSCPQCQEAFEPDFKLLVYPDTADIMEAKEATVLGCPCCGFPMQPAMKEELNWNGRWVKDGTVWLPKENQIVARNGMRAARSTIASFWMKGPAAAYQDWGELVENYLRAVKALEDTGDDAPLRKTVTTDQGMYYIPQSRLSERSPEDLKNVAEDWGSTEDEPTVPHGVRFIIAAADVQKTSFVVQVHGFMANGDMAIIDGFKVRLSNRLNGNGERLPIEPSVFGEDWQTLVEEVLQKTYPLADGSGRRMRIRALGCDSGGAEGVTTHAYNTWRKLRKDGNGDHRRFCLVKGEPSKTWPRARTTWPDSSKKDKHAVAKGDVPVILLNSNLMKDQVSVMMARSVADEANDEVKGGKLRFPDWMPDWFYNQMTTEIRTEKGWDNPRKRRNESFDLAYYALGLAIRPMENHVPYITFNVDRLDFADPPIWAADWDENELVFGVETVAETPVRKKSSFADLAAKLA
jgi:phage terminase large subunit GpA-like protein